MSDIIIPRPHNGGELTPDDSISPSARIDALEALVAKQKDTLLELMKHQADIEDLDATCKALEAALWSVMAQDLVRGYPTVLEWKKLITTIRSAMEGTGILDKREQKS